MTSYTSSYKFRLIQLNLLTLMYQYELNDLLFFISKSYKTPSDYFNIHEFVQFSSSSTRSFSASKLQYIRSRHTVVCQRPRNQEIRAGTPVCYLRDRSSSRFQPIITQKLWRLFLPNLHILMPSYTVPYIPNLKEIAQTVPEI